MKRVLLSLFVILAWGGPAIAQDPNLVLTVQGGQVGQGATADFVVSFDNTGPDDVDGWSYGVCHDPAVLTINSSGLGTTTQTVNGGGAPGFESLATLPGEGYTLGIVIDLFGVQKLAPGTGYELSTANYTAIGMDGDMTDVCICGTLGVPPVANVIVVAGASVAATEFCGTVEVTAEAPFVFKTSSATIEFDGPSGVASTDAVIQLSVEDSVGRDSQGFSMGLRHDGTFLTLTSSQLLNQVAGINMGAGPAFLSENLSPANGPGYTIGAVYSLMGGVFLQLTPEDQVIELTYSVDASTLADPMEPGNTVGTPLNFENTMGTPPVENLIVVEGGSLVPILAGGSVTLVPVYGIDFVRSDCNDDGFINVADPIWIISQLFDNGPVGGCAEACDANADGMIDASDAIFAFTYLFSAGIAPSAPFPNCDNMPGSPCDTYNNCP